MVMCLQQDHKDHVVRNLAKMGAIVKQAWIERFSLVFALLNIQVSFNIYFENYKTGNY